MIFIILQSVEHYWFSFSIGFSSLISIHVNNASVTNDPWNNGCYLVQRIQKKIHMYIKQRDSYRINLYFMKQSLGNILYDLYKQISSSRCEKLFYTYTLHVCFHTYRDKIRPLSHLYISKIIKIMNHMKVIYFPAFIPVHMYQI